MPVVRLGLLLTCLGLAISRVGLIAHELLGHGGAALAYGGDILEVNLFWFAGGWIRTSTPTASMASRLIVELGGIAVELALGLGLLALARWRAQLAAVARLAGLVLIAHSLWYAATGTWHGFGDGARLHALLGPARYPVALALGAALCAVAVLGARALARTFAPQLPGTTARRLAAALLATALAGALHGALTFAEIALRRDATYTETMRTTAQRRADQRLAQLRAAAVRAGHPFDDTQLAAAQQTLRPPRPFPFARLLAAAVLAALLLGTWTLRHADFTRPERSTARWRPPRLPLAALAAALAITAVILLDLW